MATRLFDHLDLRVRDLATADRFYSVVLPALGFTVRKADPAGILFEADTGHPAPEMIGLIEDETHVPNATRVAFWRDSPEEVDRFATLLRDEAAAQAVEGPMLCPEYSPGYYAIFFEDPCGNKLEVCHRPTAEPVKS